MVVDITFNVLAKFQKDSRSYVSSVTLHKVVMTEVYIEKTLKQIFEVEQIQLGEKLKEGI
jgi:hypothetical protein